MVLGGQPWHWMKSFPDLSTHNINLLWWEQAKTVSDLVPNLSHVVPRSRKHCCRSQPCAPKKQETSKDAVRRTRKHPKMQETLLPVSTMWLQEPGNIVAGLNHVVLRSRKHCRWSQPRAPKKQETLLQVSTMWS